MLLYRRANTGIQGRNVLSTLYRLVGVVAGVLAILFIVLYLRYRRVKRQQYEQHLNELSREITYALESHGARHPQLIENKLAAAEEQWANGDYRDAEQSMQDLLNIIRLS